MDAPRFAWKDEYSVGVRALDLQHARLIAAIDELGVAMAEARGYRVMRGILTALAAYTEEHFTTEERMLQRFGYPELDRHLALHRSFTQSVARYGADLQASRAVLSVAVFRFLKNWLEGHILTEDMQYRPHLNSRGLR